MKFLPSRANISSVLPYLLRHKKIVLPFLILLIAVGIIFRPKSTPEIETEKVIRENIAVSVSGTGSIVSETSVNLSFITSGKLTFLGVRTGDRVTPYQTIATMDIRTTQKSLESALRDYAKQRNTFEQTKANNGNATPETAATEQVKRVLENNQYDLDKAVISVELQDLAKQNSVVTTPIGGVVTRADVQSAGVNIGPTTVFSIADPDHLLFDIDVDEADIGKINPTQKVKVILDAYPEETLTLAISNIDFASHATSTGGTAYTVHAVLPDNSGEKYRIGMSGEADIIVDERPLVLSIPLAAIVDDSYVYVKKGKTFEKRNVTLGLRNDTKVEVKKGLENGDVIATQPSQLEIEKK